MKRTTINRKLLKLNISILSLALIILGITIIYIIRVEAENTFIERSEGILNYSSQQLGQVFDSGEHTLETIQTSYLNRVYSASHITNLLSSLQESNTMYEHTFVVFKNGDYILTPNNNVPSDFDPLKRSWYIEALANYGEHIWSDPYFDIDTNKLVITCSKAFRDPVRKENIVIGIDIVINNLDYMITSLTTNSYGYMMLVNDDDTIILHTDKSLINSQIQSYEDDILIAEFHSKTPLYRTKTGIFMQQTLSNQKMYLIRYFSNKDLLESTIPFIVLFIGLIALSLVVSVLTSFSLSRRITTPLNKLKDTISSGLGNNLLVTCDFTTNDEISELIDGYNFLVNDINEKTLEMTALYEQLAASEETLQEQYDQLFENREQIRFSEEKYRLLSEASTQGLMEIHSDNSLTFHSSKWFEQFDLPAEHVMLKDWLNLIVEDDLSHINESLMNHFNKKTAVFNEEYRLKTNKGNIIWIASFGQAFFNADGSTRQMIISNTDITKRKHFEAEILTMAYTDELTGLLNRSRLKDVINESIEKNEQGTMFYIDLDNFKFLNDTYGHSYGDRVLIELARRLEKCKDGNCQLARISGDEFAIVSFGTLSLAQIEENAKKIIKTISQKIILDDIELYTTGSVGAASYPYDASTFEELLVNADISMHRAKSISKASYTIFTDDIKNEMLYSMKIERNLSHALKNNEISVYYQPVVRAHNNEVVGFEALARWTNPELGSIPPDIFIQIAEKNQFIIPLGNYIMRQAMQFILDINKEFNTHYEIALNISAIQLQQENFVEDLTHVAEEYNYPIECLNLEITESVALDSDTKIIENLKALYDKGYPISLDDFGTGYSTFNNLIELPINHLKLDKGIVQRSVTDDNVYTLINSIVEFSHQMNIKVIAEGIEDMFMLDRMQNLKVDFAQGYMYSKPVDSIKLRQLIKNGQL
jgi:diguanylate cyclase (GGDEF)-like protein/PAS domain S-box-containing protein